MKILVISPYFPDEKNAFIKSIFVKEQLLDLRNSVDGIMVVSPVPFTMGITEAEKHCKNYRSKNMLVEYPRFLHLPIRLFRERMDKREAKIILKIINKNKWEFDIIHCHFTWPSGGAGAVLADQLKKPFVVTIHENKDWFEEELNSKDEKLENIWKSADQLIRVNTSDLEILHKYNNNVIFMPVGFNRNRLPILNKSVSRLKLGIDVDEIVLFSFGNLIERKGFHFLIEAVRLLIEDDRKIVCYIGGEGDYRSALEKLIEEKGLGRNIRMLGRIPEDDISTWVCACDLFVVPSTRESFGLTVVEALACGRPVVATKNGGSEEIIKDDRVGYLCEVKDPVDMAMKIKKALISQWDSEFIIAFAEDYSWQRINIELLATYQRILNRRNG